MAVYLDYNATTPIDGEVAEVMLPYLYQHFGNPSSSHAFGKKAREAVENARGQVARSIGARPEQIAFTSGGTESNNWVIQGIARKHRGGHVVTSTVEHPAVLEPCALLAAERYQVTKVSVDKAGRVDPVRVAEAITRDTILVTIMHANNEVGTIQPIPEIAELTRERGVLLHTDAAQSVGKIPLTVDELGIDFLSIAGHKLYAPKGVGALYIREDQSLPRLIHGAGHESGRRAGTENVLEIVALGKACEIAARDLEDNGAHMKQMRDRLWQSLSRTVQDLRLNGDLDHGLPNTLSVGFRGIEASALLAQIGDRVAASAGAACHADGVHLSTVLEAMEVPLEYATGTVRFSVGKMTTAQEIDSASAVVVEALGRR